MAGFRIQLFKGIRPRISARKLPVGEAQTAQNAKLGSGDLRAWDEKDSGVAVDNIWYNKTVYRFDNDGTPRWFQWNTLVDVARGPIKDDSLERTYYTGDGVPKMTYTTIADAGGGGPYPEATRDLGIPAPPNSISTPASALPENTTVAGRTFSGLTATAFIVGKVQFTTYPGTGSDNQTWRRSTSYGGGLGVGILGFTIGDVDTPLVVMRVIDSTHVELESAVTPGVFASQITADWSGETGLPSIASYVKMDEQGSTKESTFINWVIPSVIATSGAPHLLSQGDVIRFNAAVEGGILQIMEFPIPADLDFYEQSWDAEVDEPISAGSSATAFIVRNARISASAVEGDTFALAGEYTINISRAEGEASEEIQDRQYVYTYVSFLGEEGPPSPVSGIVNSLHGDTVVLSGFENVFTADNLSNRDIDFFRVYRTNSTEAGTEFQFVGEVGTGSVAKPTTQFVDSVIDSLLGEAMESTTWFPPVTGMEGIITMPNGMLVGFKGKTVFFSEPYSPHAWPPEYDQAVNFDIVGIAAMGNSVVVVTKGIPYIITGSHPRSMNVRPFKLNQSCLNKESIASDGDKVYYASPDGLVEISVNGAALVTDPYTRKEEWASYSPSTMVGEFHDGKYFGFFGGPASVTQSPVTVSLSGTLTASATETDIQDGGKLLDITIAGAEWEDGGANFNAERQAIIDSLVSDKSEAHGWNVEQANIAVSAVTRINNLLARITMPALANFEITAEETLSMVLLPTVFKATEPAGSIIVSDTFSVVTDDDFSSRLVFITDTGFYGYSTGDADEWVVATLDPAGISLSVPSTPERGAQHIAYDNKRGRWTIAVGDLTPTTKPIVYTSDNDTTTWVRRESLDNVFFAGGVKIRHLKYYPEYDLYLGSFGQVTPLVNGNSAVFSKDGGENWEVSTVDSVGGNEMATGETGFDTLNGTFFIPAFKNNSSAPKLVVASAAVPQDNWTAETINVDGTPLDILDTVATGNGKAVYAWLSGIDNDIEIGYYKPSDQTHNSVGVITNSGAVGLFAVFGNSKFMVMSDTSAFTLATADGSEETIGNWSAMSSAITGVGSIAVHNLYYDGGDGTTVGWGWVLCGSDLGDSKGVIYTSVDNGANWVLRHKTTANAVILSCAFNNYTTDLEKS